MLKLYIANKHICQNRLKISNDKQTEKSEPKHRNQTIKLLEMKHHLLALSWSNLQDLPGLSEDKHEIF